MLLTLLSLTCQRAQAQAPELSNLIHAMRVKDAAGIGRRRLERNGRDTGTPQEGALLGRSLLLVGMEEAASEVFHQQLKAYDQVSRSNVRWQSALDQAWLFHHLNKPARAVACWAIVAGDHEAPVELRVEGHCGKALSLQALGQHAEALATARQAEALCQAGNAAMLEPHAQAIRLEVLARVHLLRHEELTDHALSESAVALARDLPRRRKWWPNWRHWNRARACPNCCKPAWLTCAAACWDSTLPAGRRPWLASCAGCANTNWPAWNRKSESKPAWRC